MSQARTGWNRKSWILSIKWWPGGHSLKRVYSILRVCVLYLQWLAFSAIFLITLYPKLGMVRALAVNSSQHKKKKDFGFRVDQSNFTRPTLAVTSVHELIGILMDFTVYINSSIIFKKQQKEKCGRKKWRKESLKVSNDISKETEIASSTDAEVRLLS